MNIEHRLDNIIEGVYRSIYLYRYKNKLAGSTYVTLFVCDGGGGIVDAQGMAPAAIVESGKRLLQWYRSHYTVRDLGERIYRLYQLE
ncbi:hypothetical protein AB1283_12725 [Bacillus sp. S13(2024)]|uniref:hypothetical protein n=1 Tax=unclassified Bacillus (in: firmicutes) TaxID=185979 RepID=UPI003D248D2F